MITAHWEKNLVDRQDALLQVQACLVDVHQLLALTTAYDRNGEPIIKWEGQWLDITRLSSFHQSVGVMCLDTDQFSPWPSHTS